MSHSEFCQLAVQHGLRAQVIHGHRIRLWLDRANTRYALCVSLRGDDTGFYSAWGVEPFPHALTGSLIPRFTPDSFGLAFSDPMEPISAIPMTYQPSPAYWYDKKMFLIHLHGANGGRCVYCEKPIRIKDATLDHIQPTCYGGEDISTNWTIACSACNQDKGDHTVMEYAKRRGVESFPLLELR